MRIDESQNPPVDHADTVRKFLAFPVWNHMENKVQVWEVTQATLQRELISLDKDKDWGDLTQYDVEIERTGNDKNTTKYRITPKPKSELSPEAQKASSTLPELKALYYGEDPFTYVDGGERIDGSEDVVENDLPF